MIHPCLYGIHSEQDIETEVTQCTRIDVRYRIGAEVLPD